MINHVYAFFIMLLLSYSSNLIAQVGLDTKLRALPENTEIRVQTAFEIPADAKSVMLDNGKGKICSCQLFTPEPSAQSRSYTTEETLLLRTITIKGLFDGSQMHVARIYFHNTRDYFKLKCYAREILVEHIAEFLRVDDVDSLVKED